jgi:hypothetical protein
MLRRAEYACMQAFYALTRLYAPTMAAAILPRLSLAIPVSTRLPKYLRQETKPKMTFFSAYMWHCN